MTTTASPPARARGLVTALLVLLRLLGASLLAAMGWIHLDLWLAGYRDIDVIGSAFLLDVVAGFGLAAVLLVTPRVLLRAVAVLGALTAAVTLAAQLWSTYVGLFGFQESVQAQYWSESVVAEGGAVVVLGLLALVASHHRAG